MAAAAMSAPTLTIVTSYKKHFLGTILFENFFLKDEVVKFYQDKTKTAFTPDMCETLIVYYKNGNIQFVNPKDRAQVAYMRTKSFTYDQQDFCMSPDGSTLYSTDQLVIVVTTHFGTSEFKTKAYDTMKMHISPIQRVPMYSKLAFSTSGKNVALAFAGGDCTKTGNSFISLHDSLSGSVLGTVELAAKEIVSLCFSHDDAQICVITKMHKEIPNLWIIDTLTMTIKTSIFLKELKNLCIYTHKVSWSPDKSTIVIPTYKTLTNELGDGTGSLIGFINLDSNCQVQAFYMAGFDFTVAQVYWNSTSDKLCFNITDHANNMVGVYDVKSYQCTLKTYEDDLTHYISSVYFLPDGRLIVNRAIEETPGNWKDKSYKPSYKAESPPDNEVPYTEIVVF